MWVITERAIVNTDKCCFITVVGNVNSREWSIESDAVALVKNLPSEEVAVMVLKALLDQIIRGFNHVDLSKIVQHVEEKLTNPEVKDA